MGRHARPCGPSWETGDGPDPLPAPSRHSRGPGLYAFSFRFDQTGGRALRSGRSPVRPESRCKSRPRLRRAAPGTAWYARFPVPARHQADSTNADAWEGLTLAAWQSGDRAEAMAYGRRAIGLHPKQSDRPTYSRYHRSGLGSATAATTSAAFPASAGRSRPRVIGSRFPVRGAWRPFYIKGVNMGVALPGKFPSEFPPDSATYAGWLDTIAALHANTLRVYTILPPCVLPRAPRLEPGASAARRSGWCTGSGPSCRRTMTSTIRHGRPSFRQEMREGGRPAARCGPDPVRPGHAGGRYDADVSRWTLAYILGREWEPFAVKEFDAKHPGTRHIAAGS